MNYNNLIFYTSILTAINSLIGSIELFNLRNIFEKQGIYRLSNLKKELLLYPAPVSKIILFFNQDSLLHIILILKIIASTALLMYSSPFIVFFLILSNLLLALRFRGTFNGGSDYMTNLTLIALFLGTININNKIFSIFFMYLAVQVILSYFLAGIAKIKDSDWRSGKAIKLIVTGPNYSPPAFLQKLLSLKTISFIFSWIVIIFELLFPLIIFVPNNLILIFSCLIIFHFINFVLFGLNRFLFAWMAAYPAVYYFVTNLPSTK